jgi:indolepyruvate ferredoxin oxidoreductase beta subunit
MESLRYLPYLNKEGWLITNSTPFVNITNYPEMEELKSEIEKLDNSLFVEGDKVAKEIENPRGMNMVMLGAASKHLGIEFEKLEEGIKFIFGRKGEAIVEGNLRALRAGRELAK